MRGKLILSVGLVALALAGAAVSASTDAARPKRPHRPAPVSLPMANACNGANDANKAACADIVCGEMGDYNQGYISGQDIVCYQGNWIHYP